MTAEQIKFIQELFAPVFDCRPDELEVGEGYCVCKTTEATQSTLQHEWTVEVK